MPHTPMHRWEERENEFRTDWERTYPNRPWNEARSGYRYGWEMGYDDRYRNRSWSESESDLRTGWTNWSAQTRTEGGAGQQMEQTWESIKDSVREGWERARREFNKMTS
ncbi:MAG: hypothetical protein KatS3mg057_3046 [Herpetosiphonaceae bacterium]|nr:MAG: hypothetical protein KatS3mg057_3046 [Herpetosiphonaceae bacterium]